MYEVIEEPRSVLSNRELIVGGVASHPTQPPIEAPDRSIIFCTYFVPARGLLMGSTESIRPALP
jgi:hypothetical protein